MARSRSRQDIQLQLSRWARAGKIHQLCRGVYVLSETYRKVQPHPFLIANRIRQASYVSLQSALAWYGLIPDYTPVVTSVTTGRPGKYDTDEGTYWYRHVKKSFFHVYNLIQVTDGQQAFVAGPEKSLLDLVYLTPDGQSMEYLRQLRLQNTEGLNIEKLTQLARESRSRKLITAAERIGRIIKEEGEYIEL